MVVTRWATVLAVGAGSLALVLPAGATSAVTQALLDNLTPNIDFLDRSSRFALKNSKSAKVRAFAFSQAREQTLAANAVYDYTTAAATSTVASTHKGGSEKSLDRADLDRATTASILPPALPSASKREQPAVDDRLPRSQEDLDSMEGLEGAAFDSEYKEKQRDALQQIEGDYTDYIAQGDDPLLKKIAVRELPKVKRRLLEVGHL